MPRIPHALVLVFARAALLFVVGMGIIGGALGGLGLVVIGPPP